MIESKPLNKLALIALREVERTTNATVQEIIVAAAEADGVDLAFGWRLDPKSGTWKRETADATE